MATLVSLLKTIVGVAHLSNDEEAKRMATWVTIIEGALLIRTNSSLLVTALNVAVSVCHAHQDPGEIQGEATMVVKTWNQKIGVAVVAEEVGHPLPAMEAASLPEGRGDRLAAHGKTLDRCAGATVEARLIHAIVTRGHTRRSMWRITLARADVKTLNATFLEAATVPKSVK